MMQTIGCKRVVTTIGLLFLFIGNAAIAEDSLVAAAGKFAETAMKHGRDTYGRITHRYLLTCSTSTR